MTKFTLATRVIDTLTVKKANVRFLKIMIFYYIFLLKSLDGKLTSDFKFPDPIRDRETPFCPIDPLLTTNAEVRCTNSAFRTEFNNSSAFFKKSIFLYK